MSEIFFEKLRGFINTLTPEEIDKEKRLHEMCQIILADSKPMVKETWSKTELTELLNEALSYGYHTAKDEEKGIRSAGYADRFLEKHNLKINS